MDRATASTQAPPTGWRARSLDAAFLIARAVGWGFLAGALIGGIGGRLAMFALRLTSDPLVRGLKTDDEFTIGDFTASTFDLVVFTALLGAVGALFYLVIRDWLPPRRRPVLYALFGAIVGGAAFIHPGGVDFTRLDPLSLAIAMFIALPAAYGALVSALLERPARPRPSGRRACALQLAPLALLLPAFPVAIGVLLVIGVVAADGPGRVTRLWRSTAIVWTGRAALALLAAISAVYLGRAVVEIL